MSTFFSGRTLRALIAISLTTYVLWHARPSAVLDVLARADARWIAASIALVVCDRTLMAYRWIVLLTPVESGGRPPLISLIRLFFISTFAGTFLPASIGSDVVRAYGLSRLQVAMGPAVASVLMDRLLGLISILLVGLASLALGREALATFGRAIEWPLAIGGVVSLAAGAVIFSDRAADLAQTLARRLPIGVLRRTAADTTTATRAYSRYHAALANVLAGSIGVQILRIVQAYCLGRALGVSAPLATYFVIIPLVLLVMLLPISINGIGPSQIAFVWFFGRVGVPEADAFALSVLFVALGVVGNLPGGLLYVAGSRLRAPGSGLQK